MYAETLKRNLKLLKDSKAVVFVVDSPMILSGTGMKIIDIKKLESYRWSLNKIEPTAFRALLVNALRGNEPTEFTGVDHLQRLIHRSRGDFSSMIQTMTVKSRLPEKRREFVAGLVNWLLTSGLESELEKYMKDTLAKDHQTLEDLKEFFNTETGKDAIKVFGMVNSFRTGSFSKATEGLRDKGKKDVVKATKKNMAAERARARKEAEKAKKRTGSPPYDKICQGTTIHPFDVKFLLRSYGSQFDYTKLSSREAQKDSIESAVLADETLEGIVASETDQLQAILDMEMEFDMEDTI